MTPVGFSYPSKTCLNLISNDKSSSLSDQLCHTRGISFRKGIESSNSLNRFEDETSQLILSNSGIKSFLNTFDEAIDILIGSSVGVRPCQFFKFKSSSHTTIPGASIGEIGRISNKSVVGMLQTEELVLLSVQPSQIYSEVVGLAPRVTKIDAVILSSQFLTKPLAVISLPLIEVNLRNVLQLAYLLGCHLGDGWVRVANRDRRDSANEIEVSPAFVVIEVLHASLGDQEGLLVVVEI